VNDFEASTAWLPGGITTRADIGLLVTGIGYDNPDPPTVMTRTVDCSQTAPNTRSTAGVFKVALRLDGSTDQTRCTTGQKAMAHLVPQRLYCLQPAVR
jgi:hypothetical protein